MRSVQIGRHESETGGTHEFALGAPHPALAAHVRRYCGYREDTPAPMRRRELPSTDVTLIIGFEQDLRVGLPVAGRAPEAHDSFLAGLAESYAVTEFTGRSGGIEVNLAPAAVRMLFGIPMHELTNRVLRLEDVLGEEGRRLPERLYVAGGWEARFELLDAFIAARLAGATPPAPALDWAWGQLHDADGRIGIGDIARALGCSRRYLVAQFRDHVGLPPKTVARILRFQRALAAFERDDGRRFAEIAQDCGYHDQPHLNREFRDFAGVTPSEALATRLPAGLGRAA